MTSKAESYQAVQTQLPLTQDKQGSTCCTSGNVPLPGYMQNSQLSYEQGKTCPPPPCTLDVGSEMAALETANLVHVVLEQSEKQASEKCTTQPPMAYTSYNGRMTLDAYQRWTRSTAMYEDNAYPMLALAEECGEFLGKIAKYVRDDTSEEKLREDLIKEAGDILWQLTRVLDDMYINIQDCLDANVEKLESRKARGVLGGSGDNR